MSVCFKLLPAWRLSTLAVWVFFTLEQTFLSGQNLCSLEYLDFSPLAKPLLFTNICFQESSLLSSFCKLQNCKMIRTAKRCLTNTQWWRGENSHPFYSADSICRSVSGKQEWENIGREIVAQRRWGRDSMLKMLPDEQTNQTGGEILPRRGNWRIIQGKRTG